MPVTKDTPAPYAPPSVILDIVTRHRMKGLPSPINAEVLGRSGVSESLIPRSLQALKSLDLITEDGKPTPVMEGLRLAPEADYPQRVAQWLADAYSDVLTYTDPATASETDLRDAFRHYNPVGQQPRMVVLFQGLFSAAGIGAEKTSSRSNRKPRTTTASNGSPKAQQTPSPGRVRASVVPAPIMPPKPPASDALSDKALEYKLVDLMKNADIQENERAAVWTLVQYLTARAQKAEAEIAKFFS